MNALAAPLAPFPTFAEIRASQTLSPLAKLLLGKILEFQRWVCWASNGWLARQLGIDNQADRGEKAIRRALNELIGAGFLRRVMAGTFRRWFDRVGRQLGLELPRGCAGHRFLIVAAAVGPEPLETLPLWGAEEEGKPDKSAPPDLPALSGSNRTNPPPQRESESESLSGAKTSVRPSAPEPCDERTNDSAPAVGEEPGNAPSGPLGPLPAVPGAMGDRLRALASKLPPTTPSVVRPAAPISQGNPVRTGWGCPPAPSKPLNDADRALLRAASSLGVLGEQSDPAEAVRLAAELAAGLGEPNPGKTVPIWARTFQRAIDGALTVPQVVAILHGLVGARGELYKAVSVRLANLKATLGA